MNEGKWDGRPAINDNESVFIQLSAAQYCVIFCHCTWLLLISLLKNLVQFSFKITPKMKDQSEFV